MLLFGISGGEILIVFLVFLLFFGAKSIPGLARTLGRTVRQFKDATQDIQREMSNAAGSVKKQVDEHRRILDQMGEVDKPRSKPDSNPGPDSEKGEGSL